MKVKDRYYPSPGKDGPGGGKNRRKSWFGSPGYIARREIAEGRAARRKDRSQQRDNPER